MYRILALLAVVLFSEAASAQIGRNPAEGTIAAIVSVAHTTENAATLLEECSWRAKMGAALDSLGLKEKVIQAAISRDAVSCVPDRKRPHLYLLDWTVTDTSVTVRTMRVALNGSAIEEYFIERQGPLYSVVWRKQSQFGHSQ